MSVSPTTRLEAALWELCARYGYCGASAVHFDPPPGTVNEFVDAVLVAEGLEPDLFDKGRRRELSDLVRDWLFDDGRGKGSKSGLP